MTNLHTYKPRLLTERLRDAIEFSPVVVLSGARQTGKSTLLKMEEPFNQWHYISFDDLDMLALARENPEEIINISDRLIIDEAQRSPDFVHAVKVAVDQDRSKRIILSGSANILLMKRVSESLAGRAIYLNLMPFSLNELMEVDNDWITFFLKNKKIPDSVKVVNEKVVSLSAILFRGFMPEVSFMKKERHISMWWEGYVKTYLERDVRDIANISFLPDFRTIMELLADRTAHILKQSEVARDASLSQATLGRYINILEATNLFIKLRPYSKNISKRLIKSPKGFFVDPGLIVSLTGHTSSKSVQRHMESRLLESFILLNLIVHSSAKGGTIYYFRTQGGKEREIDFIFERENRLIPIEVKLTDHISVRDIKNILYFKDISDRYIGGLVIYAGNEIKQLSTDIYAIPWQLM